MQNPIIDALAKGGSVSSQTASTANSFLNSSTNAFNVAGSLAMKMTMLLEQEEARKQQEALQSIDMIHKIQNDVIKNKLAERQVEIDERRNEINYDRLEFNKKQHKDNLEFNKKKTMLSFALNKAGTELDFKKYNLEERKFKNILDGAKSVSEAKEGLLSAVNNLNIDDITKNIYKVDINSAKTLDDINNIKKNILKDFKKNIENAEKNKEEIIKNGLSALQEVQKIAQSTGKTIEQIRAENPKYDYQIKEYELLQSKPKNNTFAKTFTNNQQGDNYIIVDGTKRDPNIYGNIVARNGDPEAVANEIAKVVLYNFNNDRAINTFFETIESSTKVKPDVLKKAAGWFDKKATENLGTEKAKIYQAIHHKLMDIVIDKEPPQAEVFINERTKAFMNQIKREAGLETLDELYSRLTDMASRVGIADINAEDTLPSVFNKKMGGQRQNVRHRMENFVKSNYIKAKKGDKKALLTIYGLSRFIGDEAKIRDKMDTIKKFAKSSTIGDKRVKMFFDDFEKAASEAINKAMTNFNDGWFSDNDVDARLPEWFIKKHQDNYNKMLGGIKDIFGISEPSIYTIAPYYAAWKLSNYTLKAK